MPKIVAVDIETNGLGYNSSILTIGAAWNFDAGRLPGRGKAWSVAQADLFNSPDPLPKIMVELDGIVQEAELVTLHNASFDLSFLFKQGILQPTQVKGKVFDTLLTARMTGARDSLSLDWLCQKYGIGDSFWQGMKVKRTKLNKLPVQTVLEYNLLDAQYTLALAERLWDESVAIYGKDFTIRESDFCRLMAEVRVRGKELDLEAIEEHRAKLYRKRRRLLNWILFDPHVGIQGANDRTGLIRYLKINGFYDFEQTEAGNESVSKDELRKVIARLKELDAPNLAMVCRTVQELRHIEKIMETYLVPLVNEHADGNGFVHPAFSVGGTTTYRLSSSEPNGQNMPRELAYVLWKPYLSADYSQAELRLAAIYAREHSLAQTFADGVDAHLDTAKRMFGEARAKQMRSVAKNINFATLYGSGPKTISQRYECTVDDAISFLNLHRQVYPSLHKATRLAQETWAKRKHLKLVSGKRLYATKDDLERGYKAFNNLVQGGVGELVKEAMLRLDAAGLPIIGQVHDSIEFRLPASPQEDAEMRQEIQNVMSSVLPEDFSNRTEPPIVMKADLEIKGKQRD